MIILEAWHAFKKIAWFLPGFILYASFPPMGDVMNVLFALAPLLWLARQGDVKQSVVAWAKSGFFFWFATLSWMPAIVKNGGPWALVILGWLALAAYCTFYFSVFGYLAARYWSWVERHQLSGSVRVGLRLLGILFVEPVLWCGLELVRSVFGGGFAWNQLGVVPANAGFGAPAALGGVYLLSAVVVLVNGSIAGIVERIVMSIRRKSQSRWRLLETPLAFALIFVIYSLPTVETPFIESESLSAVLVQRNFPCCFSSAKKQNPVQVYSNLLQNVSSLRPDLLVLPESAISEFGALDGYRGRKAFSWLKRVSGAKAVLAGGGRCSPDGLREYNSAGLYTDAALDVYDKVHLVPFGEFIPGDKVIPALQKLAPVGSCTPGKPKLLGKAGVAICYEDTDSALCRRFAEMGAEFLVFITNDSWFSHSNEPRAHAWQATARAIETGLPVLRVGNSGVTGVVDAKGNQNWLMGANGRVLVDRRGIMVDRIRPRQGRTLYTKFGDCPLALLFVLLIGAMILVKYSNYLQRKRLLK